MGLKRVFFHGIKSTEQLNLMYEEFDVGLGCLALHRRNANIDTTLKIIEYYCRGIPVVTSGNTCFENEGSTIRVEDGEGSIDIEKIYVEWKKIESEKLKLLSHKAKKVFSWDSIMQRLLIEK